jgi:hypothetical protein
MNTCGTKWIDEVKNEYIQEKNEYTCIQEKMKEYWHIFGLKCS